MITAERVWQNALPLIRENMTDISYAQWVEPLVPFCIKGATLVLITSAEDHKQLVVTLHQNMLMRCINRANESNYLIRVITEKEKADFSLVESGNSLRLNPKYTFDSFVIGSSNEFAHAAAMAVAEDPSNAYNPFFIYGGVGLGKTHLMHAIGNTILARNPNLRIIYVTSEKFTNEFIQSIQDKTNAQFRNKYRSADVLMVDDIQFISTLERTQEEFFNTFNDLHTAGKQIILSSDRPPVALTTLEERLRSRFEWGLITDIQPPDLETRIAILKKKMEENGVILNEDVLSGIAERVNSNIRQLEGSLTRVLAYSRLTKKPIDNTMVTNALRDIAPTAEAKIITIPSIMSTVAEFYGVDIDALCSQRRTQEITLPRQVAMYLAKELTDESLKTIGRSFGGRDHTTVINACRKIKQDVENNSNMNLIIEDLAKRIRLQ